MGIPDIMAIMVQTEEELTLYVIEMKSELEQLKSKNELMEIKIKAFEAKDKVK